MHRMVTRSVVRPRALRALAASFALVASLAARDATAAPIITSVEGCTNDSTGTSECSALGNVPITVRGQNFGAIDAHVYVGGVDCPVSSTSDQQVVCELPPGNGKNVDLVVTDSTGLSSFPARSLSYSPPSITSVTGCTPGSDGSPTECARTGGDIITIVGENFGPSGSSKTVMVGGEVCPTSDDFGNEMTCTLPPGTGADKPVLVLAANQLSRGDPYTVSLSSCPGGTRVYPVTGACVPCEAGEFSNSLDSETCHPCPAGTVPDASHSSCTGATDLQCWSVKDSSATRFTAMEDVAVTDELATAQVDLKKPALYCTAADVSGTGIAPPDVQQCCYQAKGSKLSVPRVAVAQDDIGEQRSLSIVQPKFICTSCTATLAAP
jgi:hypothetical protein